MRILEREGRHWMVDGKSAGWCCVTRVSDRDETDYKRPPGKISEIGIAGDLPLFRSESRAHGILESQINARCHE